MEYLKWKLAILTYVYDFNRVFFLNDDRHGDHRGAPHRDVHRDVRQIVRDVRQKYCDRRDGGQYHALHVPQHDGELAQRDGEHRDEPEHDGLPYAHQRDRGAHQHEVAYNAGRDDDEGRDGDDETCLNQYCLLKNLILIALFNEIISQLFYGVRRLTGLNFIIIKPE